MSIEFSPMPDEGEAWMHPDIYALLYKDGKVTSDTNGAKTVCGRKIIVDSNMPAGGIYAAPTPRAMRARMAAEATAQLRRSIAGLCDSYGVSLDHIRDEAEKGAVAA